jgi:hypothetical protein
MYVEKTPQGYNIMGLSAETFRSVLRLLKQHMENDKLVKLSKQMEREVNALHRPGRDL